MIRTSIAGSLLALSLVGCAASTSTNSASMSPDAVAQTLNGANLETVRTVWQRLGETRAGRRPDTFKTAGRPAGYDAGPFTAEVFRVDLDGSPEGVGGGTDAIVRVGDPAAWDWQFLAFLGQPGGWRYAGRVDLPDNRVGAPVPQTRTLGPGLTWLLVTSNDQAGKSLAERSTRWYQVRSGRLQEVLRIPSEGHRVSLEAPFDVAYKAELLDLYLTTDNEASVSVNMEVVYTNSRRDSFPGLEELFRRNGTLRYVQDRATGRFILDAAGSDWSETELAGLLTGSADQFVHNNRVQLHELAHSGDEVKRRWVSRLVQDCASQDVKRELTAIVTAESGSER